MSLNNTKGFETETSVPRVISSAPSKPALSPRFATDYDIRVVTKLDDIENLRAFWSRMNVNPDADIDFYSLFVSLHADSQKPYVLVASQDGEPKAMWLGRLENASVPIRAGYRTLMSLRLRQIILLPEGFLGEPHPEVVQALAWYLMKELKAGVADRVYLSNTDVNLEIYKTVQRAPGFLFRDHSRQIEERWKTTLPANMDEFLKRVSKKHRYWLRRIGRVFEEAFPGRVQYKTYTKKEEIESFCVPAEQIAQTTYQRGLGVGFQNTDEAHRRLELAVDKGWWRAYVAFVGEEPVAFWSGRLYKGVMHLEWTGYKPAYRKYEAGTVLFLKMLEDLCSCGVREVDYGNGASAYKERFGDNKCVEGSLSIYSPSLRGLFSNTLITTAIITNRTAKTLARKLGVVDRVKKFWRTRLAGQAPKPAQTDGEAAESVKK
jgi:hypothetical protein